MLTVEKLKNMKPGEIFASGEGVDDRTVFNVWGKGNRIQWVAVRGQGYHDWAIYCHIISEEYFDPEYPDYYGEWSEEKIARVGDKLTRESTIRAIVPCDDEAFKLYRY